MMKTHHAVFTILTILILWNMLIPGYIFSLDMIPPNHFDSSACIYNTYGSTNSNMPFYLTLALTNKIFPFWLIQKALFFLIIFLSFSTMYHLIPTKSRTPKYYAAFLYAINPFVYVRFLAGHLGLLMAYSITPLAVYHILKFAKKPDKKNTLLTALLIALTGILNLHNLFLTLLIFAAIILAKPKKTHIKPALKIITVLLLINAFWLIPATRTSSIDTITQDDIAIFQSRPPLNYNTIFTLASMHGFWRTAYDYPKDHIPFWPLIFIIILYLSVHGYLHTKDTYKNAFAATWLISIIIATGITAEYYKDIYLFLYNNIPFFKGFREPQKFIGLAVLAYAYLGALGINQLLKENLIFKKTIITIILILPFIYSYMMFLGFTGQLISQDYPQDYYETDQYLKNDTTDYNVLVLPWHLYMDFTWNQNKDLRLANPMRAFFGPHMITGDNMEAGGIYTNSKNPRSTYIESILRDKDTTAFGSKIAPMNAKYIILAKEVDYKNYLFLLNQSDLTLIKNTTNLLLFINKNPTTKIYQTDDLKTIHPLDYNQTSANTYTISRPERKYVVLAEPYDPSWTLKKSTKIKNHHLNAFIYKDGAMITNNSIDTLLIGCIISMITIIFILYSLKKSKT